MNVTKQTDIITASEQRFFTTSMRPTSIGRLGLPVK